MPGTGTFGGTLPALGVRLKSLDTAAKWPLGTRTHDENGNEYVYVDFGGTVAAKNPVTIDINYVATVSASAGRIDGIAIVAAATTDFGWVCVRGDVDADVEAAVANGDFLKPVADASSRMIEIVAVNEGGATSHPVAAHTARGVALAAAVANSARVRLF